MRIFSLMILLILAPIALAYKCEPHQKIIEKPIVFDKDRLTLTQEYQRDHYGIHSPSIKIQPKIIVLHWTSYATLDESFNAFYNSRLDPTKRPDIDTQSALNVSAHYLVDRDGTIYRLMPDALMARHVIGLNHYAIGIENVGGVDNKQDLTKQQAQADAYLVCYLKNKYPTIDYLIGHQDYLKFKEKQSSLWLERNPDYQTVKQDPGADFTQHVRALLPSKLNSKLKSSP